MYHELWVCPVVLSPGWVTLTEHTFALFFETRNENPDVDTPSCGQENSKEQTYLLTCNGVCNCNKSHSIRMLKSAHTSVFYQTWGFAFSSTSVSLSGVFFFFFKLFHKLESSHVGFGTDLTSCTGFGAWNLKIGQTYRPVPLKNLKTQPAHNVFD